MRHWRARSRPLLFLLFGSLALLLGAGLRGGSAAPEDPRCTLARSFLTAMAVKDMATVRRVMTADPHHLFGPCTFAALPTFSDPMIRGTRAILHWSARMTDPGLPTHGILVLSNDEYTHGAWQVIQPYYYPEMASIYHMRLLPRLHTGADDKALPKVLDAATRFVKAWQADDTTTMRALWYDWPHTDRKEFIPFRLSVETLAVSSNAYKETTVAYTVKCHYPFYTVTYHGALVLLKEGTTWKLRGTDMEFRK